MNSIPEFFKRSVEANPKKTAVIIQEQEYNKGKTKRQRTQIPKEEEENWK